MVDNATHSLEDIERDMRMSRLRREHIHEESAALLTDRENSPQHQPRERTMESNSSDQTAHDSVVPQLSSQALHMLDSSKRLGSDRELVRVANANSCANRFGSGEGNVLQAMPGDGKTVSIAC